MEPIEPVNPFRVPRNYFEAMGFYVFQYESIENDGGDHDTMNYHGIIVKRALYIAYMQMIEDYIKKYQILSVKRDIETTTRDEIVIASNEEENAYLSLIDFVSNYKPYVNEDDNAMNVENEVQVVPNIDIEIDPTITMMNLPCDVISNMIVNEIRGRSFNTIEDSMTFITRMMQTNTVLMRCLFAAEGEIVWRTLIAKYYDGFKFTSVEELSLDFFTKKYLGDSPLIALRTSNQLANMKDVERVATLKKLFINYVTAHRRTTVESITAISDVYLVFMYMWLWRSEPVSNRGNAMTPIRSNFGCYHKIFYIRRDTHDVIPNRATKSLHVGHFKIEIYQFHDGDKTIYINGEPITSTEPLLSVIPIAYYTGTDYVNTDVCLLLNRSRLLHIVKFNTIDKSTLKGKWTDFGDISIAYPEVRRCEAAGEHDITILKSSYKVKNPRKDPCSYLRSYSQCMQPLVIPYKGNGDKSTSKIGLIDFDELVTALTKNKEKKTRLPSSLPFIRIYKKFKGHVIGSRLFVEETLDVSKPLVCIAICTYRDGCIHVTRTTLNIEDDEAKRVTERSDNLLHVGEKSDHFLTYNYRCWPLFSAKRHMTLLLPEFTLSKCLLSLLWPFQQNDIIPFLANIDKVHTDFGHIHTTNSSNGRVIFSVDSILTSTRYYAAGDHRNTDSLTTNYRFMMDIADLRGDVSFITTKKGFFAAEPIMTIAKMMGIDISQFLSVIEKEIDTSGRDDTNIKTEYAPGIRVLICSSNRPLVAYSTVPYVREELGFIGTPYCIQCKNTSPLGGLAYEESNSERIFCHKTTCQDDFYGQK